MKTAKDIANHFDIPQEHKDALEKAIELVWHAGYEAATRWIQIEQDLPADHNPVLTAKFLDGVHIVFAAQSYSEGRWTGPFDPSHWQPISQIPTPCTPTATPQGE